MWAYRWTFLRHKLFLLLTVHYTVISTCYVLLLIFTEPIYATWYKISEHTKPCCYCGLHTYRVSYCFLWDLGNFAQNTAANNSTGDQVLSPLDMVSNIWPGQLLLKPNSWTKWEYLSWYELSTEVASWWYLPLSSFFVVVDVASLNQKLSNRGWILEHLVFGVFWYKKLWWEFLLYANYVW